MPLVEIYVNNRFKGFEFWDGVVFGSLITLVIVFITIGLLDHFDKNWWDTITRFIDTPIALVGVFLAIGSVRFQINFSRKQELAAAKAVLPLALSEMIGVAQTGIQFAAHDLGSGPIKSLAGLGAH